jgi:2-dehydro-3-deoxygluconokinase
MENVLDTLAKLKILPVIQLKQPEDAVPLASALKKGGIPAAEITFRTECAAESIRLIMEAFPDMLVGAGTVLNPRQARQAVDAGAKFIVSPGFDAATVRFCLDSGVPVFPGCSTASEVQQAVAMGVTVLKFFPAESSGGVKAMKALSAPFGQVRWIPTGGIDLKNIRAYLSFPKVIAAGGSFLAKESDLAAKDWEAVTKTCSQATELVQDEPQPETAPVPLFCAKKKKYDLVVLGEALMRLAALPDKRVTDSGCFTAYVGGSELNVASGAACLGLNCSAITSLPENDLGKRVCSAMHRLGVGTELILFDKSKTARLGLYYTESGSAPRKPKVVYDRSGSSFLGFDPDLLSPSIYSETSVFHTSGITLALPAVREAALETIRRFKKGGSLISFDVNYRANLWDEATAFQVLDQILPWVDILFVSEESSRRMFHKHGSLKEIMRSYHREYGIRIVATSHRTVIDPKHHQWNSTVYSAEKDSFFTDEAYDRIDVIDRIGSGDAFDSGALFGLLEKGTEQDMVCYGNAMAALKCTVPGDLPDVDRAEVDALILAHRQHDRTEMNR